LVDGLIPSLFTFFEDFKYLGRCVDCIKRLVKLSPRQTVHSAIQQSFAAADQEDCRVAVQITDTAFVYKSGSITNCEDLAYRQIYTYTIRNYLDMPKEHTTDNPIARLSVRADKAVLREFADLADLSGFKSAEITELRDYPQLTAKKNLEVSKPLLVTDGPGVEVKKRYGLLYIETYKRDRKFAFIYNLYSKKEERGEGITLFFVLRWRYIAFFGRPKGTISVVKNSMKLRTQYPDLTRLEKERCYYKEVSKDLEDAINPLFISTPETLFVDKMPTAADGTGRHRDGEGELDDRANDDRSAMGYETIGDAQIFEDAASHQISYDDNNSVDSIWTEKQEENRTSEANGIGGDNYFTVLRPASCREDSTARYTKSGFMVQGTDQVSFSRCSSFVEMAQSSLVDDAGKRKGKCNYFTLP
jgi:hypothetical protein